MYNLRRVSLLCGREIERVIYDSIVLLGEEWGNKRYTDFLWIW